MIATEAEGVMTTKKILKREIKTYKLQYFEAQYFELEFEGGTLAYTYTNRLSQKRVDTLFTKEPTTIVWMDSFKPGEVLFDVGANVGMYSCYAARISGARVFSFEPESQNYAELNRNIFFNSLHDRVTAYNLAASNVAENSVLYLSQFCPGYSHHDFGENRWDKPKQLGELLVKPEERLTQGCTSIRLDDVVANGTFPQPDHLKVDVDGFEWKVIDGALKVLSSPKLKTALIETDNNIPESVKIIDIMTSLGWKFSYDQMRVNQHEVVSEQVVKDRIARRKGGQNIVYFREDSYYDLFRRYADTFVAPNPVKSAG